MIPQVKVILREYRLQQCPRYGYDIHINVFILARNRTADIFTDSIFKHLEIMLTAFGFLYVDDLQTVPLNNDLRLQRVLFFLLNSTLFGSFIFFWLYR